MLWSKFIRHAKDAGHTVYIVTQNWGSQRRDITNAADWNCVEAVFCGDSSKEPFMNMKGIHIDVWIDDNPGSIVGVY